MWDAINPKNNGELISLDMIFIDEKGNLMHAIVRKSHVHRFKHKLIEGALFTIKNFKVVESCGGYRPVESSLKIIFFASTAIKKLSEDIGDIPINGFQFIKPDMIESRVHNNTILSDVVGCLYGVGDMESAGSKWKKRDIQIVTDYSAKSKITLWEEFGEQFAPYLYKKDSGPYIVIVTSTTVKEFRGEVSFSTTSASKVYVNLDIDYIRSLMQKFSTMSAGVQIIESSNVNTIPIEEEMFFNRMDIKELLESDWSPKIQEYVVTVRGKITGIRDYFGWYYISCNVCSKKIKPADGVYRCHQCNKDCKFPLVKYKIHIKVKDKTGDTTVVLFNDVAEKLLDTSAHKLFNKLPLSNNNDVPAQIESLCGKDFVYKLKLNKFNLVEGFENFTVSKLWIPDEDLEVQYKLRKEETGKNLLEDESEPKDQGNKGLFNEMWIAWKILRKNYMPLMGLRVEKEET
ncbi:replication protein A 70 kDa DNA-binding subunit B-like isoform X2 [Lycium barbarum]|uniref:replication protein A 70 kDa DNA-binding subunit B-like isoform X2 n=1 Tax=Lycium barbarum TaxID=112863 RepID=UPI00293EE3D9|nr:replication protein A 70 kDa DNA-binding subunit B-like isoform X2 [Lycium barbarum]